MIHGVAISLEMTMTTEEAADTTVHAQDLAIGTVGNVSSVTLLPAIHATSAMHQRKTEE